MHLHCSRLYSKNFMCIINVIFLFCDLDIVICMHYIDHKLVQRKVKKFAKGHVTGVGPVPEPGKLAPESTPIFMMLQ